MADPQANGAVVRQFFDAYYSGDLAGIDATVAPSLIAHAPNGSTSGLDNWKRIATDMQVGMPDMQTTIDDMVCEGDKVAVRYTNRGTHTAELFGAAPTGRIVTLTGTEIYLLFGGKIIEVWGHYNMSELYAK